MRWSLPPERYDEIRSTVADLIEDWGTSVYPFSIWNLFRKIGIKTIPYSVLPTETREKLIDMQADAFTIYPVNFNPQRTTIYYNDNTNDRERIRFTLAHELGRLVLEHPDTNEEKYEHEADIFANYFLAPAPLILEYSSIDYAAVSCDFAVSISCASSACDRAAKRRLYGPSRPLKYEQRILNFCRLEKGGGQLACI